MAGYQYSDFSETTNVSIFDHVVSDISDKETRKFPEFTSIDVSGGIKLIMEKGTKHQADIEVENAKLEHLITEVKDNELRIYFKKNLLKWNNKHATVNLTFVELEALDVSSGCYVNTHSMIKAENFELDASSGTRVILELDATYVDVDIDSGTSVTMTGRANKMIVDASSGTSLGAGDFECANVTVDADSGSSIKVWATESIQAEASSGSSITYRGNPSSTDIDADVSGSIKKIR